MTDIQFFEQHGFVNVRGGMEAFFDGSLLWVRVTRDFNQFECKCNVPLKHNGAAFEGRIKLGPCASREMMLREIMDFNQQMK